mmetsp:Transcript_2166/g.7912  ORF Transcript_2166/g.7912 Transcript_2166/m.7912 type:complete len:203 (+) Transcript_2166:1611-2219(+)
MRHQWIIAIHARPMKLATMASRPIARTQKRHPFSLLMVKLVAIFATFAQLSTMLHTEMSLNWHSAQFVQWDIGAMVMAWLHAAQAHSMPREKANPRATRVQLAVIPPTTISCASNARPTNIAPMETEDTHALQDNILTLERFRANPARPASFVHKALRTTVHLDTLYLSLTTDASNARLGFIALVTVKHMHVLMSTMRTLEA